MLEKRNAKTRALIFHCAFCRDSKLLKIKYECVLYILIHGQTVCSDMPCRQPSSRCHLVSPGVTWCHTENTKV